MNAKIEATLSNESLGIRFRGEKLTDNLLENLKLWSAYVLDATVGIVAEKSAIVHVYTSDGDFSFPDIKANISVLESNNSDTYFTATSIGWGSREVEEIASLMQFELSALWFQIVPDINNTQIDPVTFFSITDKISTGTEAVDPSIECVGNICDGQKLIWINPNWAEAVPLLSKLEELCTEYEFEWELKDKRNKI